MTAIDKTADKNVAIHRNWFALYAASDMTDVHPILDNATFRMCANKRELALTEAMSAFTEAYAARHETLIEHKVLRRQGFKSIDYFTENGMSLLPPDEYRRIRQLVGKTRPQCEFLVGGFDLMGIGHVFKQDNSGPAQCFDEPGWWAIGCGEGEAIGALEFQAHRLGFDKDCTEAMCVYHLLSAKFTAECNRLVGRNTFVTCHAFNKPIRFMSEHSTETVREAWERSAIPKMPKGVVRRIPRMLVTRRQVEHHHKTMEDLERKIFGRRLQKRIDADRETTG